MVAALTQAPRIPFPRKRESSETTGYLFINQLDVFDKSSLVLVTAA